MKSLARANIGHQWKLFLAAISVLTLSGCLIYVAVGISVANVRNFSVYERSLDADLVVINQNKSKGGRRLAFHSNVLYDIQEYEEVEQVEVIRPTRTSEIFTIDGNDKRFTFIAVDTRIDSVLIPKLFDEETRHFLKVPGHLILSKYLAQKENLVVGDTIISKNTNRAYVVAGIVEGALGRSMLGGMRQNNFVSYQTAETFSTPLRPPVIREQIRSLGVRLKPDADKAKTKAKINYYLKSKNLVTIPLSENAFSVSLNFVKEDKNSQGFLIVGLFAVLIPLFIIVQTLRSAIMAQNEQFATLRALGVPTRHLISTAMEQALWVGILGASLAFCCMQIIKWRLFSYDIIMFVPGKTILMVSASIFAAALLAGLISLFAIFKTQPQELLR